jgi:acetolactate synthase I/III small subunit
MTGRTSKIEQFIAIMTKLGLVEVSRTGIAGLARGPAGMRDKTLES